jgi:hypothetical protein
MKLVLSLFAVALCASLTAASRYADDTSFVCPMGHWNQAKLDHFATAALAAQQELLPGVATYYYPFSLPLRAALERSDRSTVPIMAYGSLMSPQSAKRTLRPAAVSSMRPVIAFGLRRIFNYYSPKSAQFGEAASLAETGMLNTELSYSTHDVVNGVVLEVAREDLLDLCRREVGYDLVPVVAVDWHQALATDCGHLPPFFVVYVLRAPEEPRRGKSYTRENIFPFPAYYDVVRQSAASYGPQFLSLYLNTTYLAGGKTTLREWETECNERSR